MWLGHHGNPPPPQHMMYPYTSGLPPGAKAPPLSLVSPAAKVTRTTATVPPMNQVSPPSGINTMGGNSAMTATRNSSFAAALRKLAKQAGDAAADPNLSRDSGRESSPGSTTATSPRAPTPKRAPPPLVFNNTQSSAINSPPVVTIAPTLAHSNLVAGDGRKSVERSSVVQSIGPMIEPLGVKQEREKMAPSIGGQERREDDRPQSKDSAAKLPGHPVISSASGHREESARGFQPYRPGDDMRSHMGPAFPPGLDPAYSAYHQAAAAAAFMQPQSFPHPAFRFDDPLLLERYRLMQPHFLPYPHPGMLAAAQGVPGLLPPGSRYPPDLIGQHFGLISPGAKMPRDHRSPGGGLDRSKSEEEIRREHTEAERKERERELERERERERREREERERLERERQERERVEKERHMRERIERERLEREREQERERERERQMSLERLRMEASRDQPSPAHRPEDPSGRYVGSIMHGTPRDSHYASDKFRMNAIISREDEARWLDQHRHPQLAGTDKERDRQYMHQQFLREQDMLMRERDRRLDLDKQREREKSVPPPINIKPKDEPNSHNPSSFHRPFERTLANGYEHNHFSEYERRIMNEKLLAHDRQMLQERSRSRSESSQEASREPSEPRRTETPSQDRVYLDKGHEGIPARLLDNDGSHLLPPAHLPPAQTLNQYDYDRPHAEYNFMMNSHKPEAKDGHFYNFLHKEAAPTVISSLDYEEQKIRQARQNGTYESEESDSDNGDEFTKEERHRQRLLLISEGPPLKARKSRKKSTFLNMFRLTTTDNKKGKPSLPGTSSIMPADDLTSDNARASAELDFERLCKKRRLYKEPAVSPIELEDSDRNSPLNYPPRLNPDSLNHTPDYKYKMRFLFDLKLQVVPVERRKQMEQIRQAIELDRRRRLHRDTEEEDSAPSSPLRKNILPETPVLNHQASPTGIKRKHHEIEGPSLEPVPSNGPDPAPRISLSQLQERHAAVAASSLPSSQPSQHPSLISQGQGHPPPPPPLGQGQSHPPPPGQGQGHPPPPPGQGQSQGHVPEANHVIYPSLGPDKEHQHRNLAREFAQEFHESVLQSTRKQELTISRPNRPDSEVRYHMEDRNSRLPERPNSAASSHLSTTPQLKLEDSYSNERSQDSTGTTSLKWPGIEAVIESYHRHLEEQRLEKNVLAEQCHHLQQKNAELHQTTEQLHRQYSELMQASKVLSERRVQAQSALDNLNKCLKLLR